MSVVDSMIKEIMGKLIAEATELASINSRATLSAREIQAAVRLCLPNAIAKHAVSEGTKAVTKFTMSQNGPKSTRAGIIFPVSFFNNELQKRSGKRVSKISSVYLASALEYLGAEVLELAGNAAKDSSTQRITPRHILLAIRSDPELDQVFKGTVPNGGVIPTIHKCLLPKTFQSTPIEV